MKRRGNVRSSEKKGNGKKVVVSMILLIVVACVAGYGIALYHGTPHDNDYIEMENGNAS